MLRRWTCAPWTRRNAPSKVFMAIAWIGMRSRSARPARKTSLFGTPALEAGRDEKARSVVALSRVPRLAGFAGSPPAAGPFQAVNRPLVRIPANRHTTTGTCEIGQDQKYAISPRITRAFFKNTVPGRHESVKPYLQIQRLARTGRLLTAARHSHAAKPETKKRPPSCRSPQKVGNPWATPLATFASA